jgi:hypothetical protein
MPLFTYRATNEDNKEVRGTLEAADANGAKTALEKMHLDGIEVTEASRNRPAPNAVPVTPQVPAFAFEGKDPNGTIHRGSLQAATKQDAFKRLRDEQKLFVNMLSPVGSLPQFRDPELEQWQKSTAAPATPPVFAPKAPPAAPAPVASTPPTTMPAFKRPTVGFTNLPVTPKPAPAAAATVPAAHPVEGKYHSISSTLRLYAGWLLAWYGLFVATGYYAMERALPWDIPFVQAFYVSPLIFSFIVAMFLFLMLSFGSRIIKAGAVLNIALSLTGMVIFVAVRLLAA